MIYQIVICDRDNQFSINLMEAINRALSGDLYNFDIRPYSDPQLLVADFIHGKLNFNILFIDIILGADNGIEIAKALRNKGFEGSIVFVTFSPDYSLESFCVYPLQYLLKPVDENKLKEVLRKDYSTQIGSRPLRFRRNYGDLLIAPRDIYYFEMVSRKIHVQTEKRIYTCNGTLKGLERTLTGLPFARCHKGYIVNLDKVVYMRRYTLSISLNKEIVEIPVGRAYYDKIMNLFLQNTNKQLPV